jgi:hypothetical protein
VVVGGCIPVPQLSVSMGPELTRNMQRFRSAFTVAAVAILIGWCGLEDGVAVRLGGEVLYRGVLGCLEVRSGGRGDADVPLEDGPGLVRGTSRMV